MFLSLMERSNPNHRPTMAGIGMLPSAFRNTMRFLGFVRRVLVLVGHFRQLLIIRYRVIWSRSDYLYIYYLVFGKGRKWYTEQKRFSYHVWYCFSSNGASVIFRTRQFDNCPDSVFFTCRFLRSLRTRYHQCSCTVFLKPTHNRNYIELRIDKTVVVSLNWLLGRISNGLTWKNKRVNNFLKVRVRTIISL